MYEHYNQQDKVYIIKEKDGERELIFRNIEPIAGTLIMCANLSQLDILKFLDYSREKKTLENK